MSSYFHLFNMNLFCCIGALALHGGLFSTPSRSILLNNANCNGSEDTLLGCAAVSSVCPLQENAAVVCQGKYCNMV